MKKLLLAGLVTTISTISMATIKDRMTCTGVSERGFIKKLLIQMDDTKPFGKNMIANTTLLSGGTETTISVTDLGFESLPDGKRMKIHEDAEGRFYLYETTYGGNFQGVGAKHRQIILIENISSVPGINSNSWIEFLDCVK